MMMVGPADITRRMRADSALRGRPASDGSCTTVGRVGTVGAGATAWRFDPGAAGRRWRSKLMGCATSTCIAVSMAGAVAPSHAGGDRSLEVQRHRLADRLLDIFATPQCVTPPMPPMRVFSAFGGPERCRLWNFEALWGRCVDVFLDVSEHDPFRSEAVAAVAERPTADLARPCDLISDERPRAGSWRIHLGCGSAWRPYRVTLTVNVTQAWPAGLDPDSTKYLLGRRQVRHVGTFFGKGARVRSTYSQHSTEPT